MMPAGRKEPFNITRNMHGGVTITRKGLPDSTTDKAMSETSNTQIKAYGPKTQRRINADAANQLTAQDQINDVLRRQNGYESKGYYNMVTNKMEPGR